jgi:polar amino acid transport system substrate-binding protein
VVLYEGVQEPYIDLEQGRIDAVVLDNIIANRYGLTRANLRAAATVGEGVYAIAVRPAEAGLLSAVDGALAAMVRDGELRDILMRWNLWDARQSALTDAPLPASDTDAHPGGVLMQLPLFLRAAGITLVISVLAMALAVSG